MSTVKEKNHKTNADVTRMLALRGRGVGAAELV